MWESALSRRFELMHRLLKQMVVRRGILPAVSRCLLQTLLNLALLTSRLMVGPSGVSSGLLLNTKGNVVLFASTSGCVVVLNLERCVHLRLVV